MGNNDTRKEWEIDIRHVLFAVRRRLWLILLVGVLLGALGLGYAVFGLEPTYASSVMFYVNNQQEGSDGFVSSQVTAAQELARTYMVILETRSVLTKAQERANANALLHEQKDGIKAVQMYYQYNQLKSMVTAEAVDNTDVFTVKVTAKSPREAFLLAEALGTILPEVVNEEVEGSRLRMVDAAVQNNNQVGPNYSRFAILGAMFGVFVTLAIVVIADIADTTIHSEDFLSAAYSDLPLLAVIPSLDEKDTRYSNYSSSRSGKNQGGAQ